MKYYAKITGVKYDNLIGGTEPSPLLRNVKASESVTRGMLLAGQGVGSDMTVAPATASDTDCSLFIAAEDFTPTALKSITTVYTRGVFNRGALVVESGLELSDFEERLRQDGIYMSENESKGGDT